MVSIIFEGGVGGRAGDGFSGIFKVVANMVIFIVLGVFHVVFLQGLALSCIVLFATASGPHSYLRTSCIFSVFACDDRQGYMNMWLLSVQW